MQKNDLNKNELGSILRMQAEKLLEGNEVSFEKKLTNEDVSVLMNELQLHQLELEMQNDELKVSYLNLDTERSKFAGLFDLAPVGYFILDYLGLIEEANQTGVELLKTSKQLILCKRFQSFISTDSYESFFSFLHKMQNSDGKQTAEIKLELADKEVIYTRMEGLAISSVLAKGVKYYITISDITDSKYAQKVLQETKERLEMTLKASSTGTWTASSVNGPIYLDEYSYDVLEIKPWEFNGDAKSFIKLVHQEDQEKVRVGLLNKINGASEIDLEFRVQGKYGEVKYIYAKGHRITDHEDKTYFAGILMDITERKRLAIEAENLRMDQHRIVLSATLTAQEKEREKISRALHDSICQILYGIKLNLQNIQLSNNLKVRFDNINQLLDQAILETRQISYELTPSVLKDFGFIAGIKEMAQRSSTPQFHIKTDIKEQADQLHLNLQLYIFRIIQELVNNAIKHSNARTAEIKVTNKDGLVTIVMSDNGTGFDINVDEALKRGSGLRGIKNRIFLLNGTIEFYSTDKGTKVVIRFHNGINLSDLERF
ncbi:MAG: PAS domain-containing protein [Bacteroidota bacterium]